MPANPPMAMTRTATIIASVGALPASFWTAPRPALDAWSTPGMADEEPKSLDEWISDPGCPPGMRRVAPRDPDRRWPPAPALLTPESPAPASDPAPPRPPPPGDPAPPRPPPPGDPAPPRPPPPGDPAPPRPPPASDPAPPRPPPPSDPAPPRPSPPLEPAPASPPGAPRACPCGAASCLAVSSGIEYITPAGELAFGSVA